MPGMLCAVGPWVRSVPPVSSASLKTAPGCAPASAASTRFRSALVMVELALALVLLICAGLMIRAFWRLEDLNTGVDSRNVATMRVAPPGTSYSDAADTNGLWAALHQRPNAPPGVVPVSLAP